MFKHFDSIIDDKDHKLSEIITKLEEREEEFELIRRCIYTAFGYDNVDDISKVYLINKTYDEDTITNDINILICNLIALNVF